MKIYANRINEYLDLNEFETDFFNKIIRNNRNKKIIFFERYEFKTNDYDYSSNIKISSDKIKYHLKDIFERYFELLPVYEETLNISINTHNKKITIE